MKRKLAVLILIVVIAMTLLMLVGCDNRPHAYLVEGVYECENISYGDQNIDKITIGVKEITGSEYDRYDPHIIIRAEKVYNIDFDIWIDGAQIEGNYETNYEFDLRYFWLSFSVDDEEFIGLHYITKKDASDNCYLSAELVNSLGKVVTDEIILNKV